MHFFKNACEQSEQKRQVVQVTSASFLNFNHTLFCLSSTKIKKIWIAKDTLTDWYFGVNSLNLYCL